MPSKHCTCGSDHSASTEKRRWILMAKLPITDGQRKILSDKSIDIINELKFIDAALIATTEANANWLRAEDWVSHVEPERFYHTQKS